MPWYCTRRTVLQRYSTNISRDGYTVHETRPERQNSSEHAEWPRLHTEWTLYSQVPETELEGRKGTTTTT